MMCSLVLFRPPDFRVESRVFRLVFSTPPRPRSAGKNIAALHLQPAFGELRQRLSRSAARRKDTAKDSAREVPIIWKRFGFGFCRKSLADYNLKMSPARIYSFAFRTAARYAGFFEVRGDAWRWCSFRSRLSFALFGSDGLFQQFSFSLNFQYRRIVFLLQGLLPSVKTLRTIHSRCCTWSKAISP